jgi:hypothetical protein
MIWLVWLLMLLIIFPLGTLLHELGHAIPALRYGAQDVKVILGSSDYEGHNIVFRRQFGRLELILASWFPLWIGSAQTSSTLPLKQRVQVLLGGPFVSLLLVVIVAPLAYVTRGESELVRALLQYTAAFEILSFIATALPIRYPRWWYGYAGHTSDMWKVIHLLRKTNTPA